VSHEPPAQHQGAAGPVTLAVLGAGSRGTGYARIAQAQGARVVAVADPDPVARQRLAADHGIAAEHVYEDWRALLAQERLADAVVVATPDRDHVGPVVAAAGRGYDILLEKPMAPTETDARLIVEAAERSGVLLTVCHVLRYTTYTRAIKEIVDSGEIGTIASIEHLEPIGWWHFAHSYVRGNWAREAESSSMLLAKSSHDLDWLSHIVAQPVRRVSSFGSLLEFRPENKPAGAGSRCVSCPVEPTCAYSAPRIYHRFLGDPVHERWPLQVVTAEPSRENLDEALESGRFGRCVYDGQNDVVDHQVVSIEYASGATASFTVVAFTELAFRRTKIFGTRGYLEGDGQTITVHDFLTDTGRVIDASGGGGASAADGHGGADEELVRAFLHAVARDDDTVVLSSARTSLDTHRIVWAAERSRRDGVVIEMADEAHAWAAL